MSVTVYCRTSGDNTMLSNPIKLRCLRGPKFQDMRLGQCLIIHATSTSLLLRAPAGGAFHLGLNMGCRQVELNEQNIRMRIDVTQASESLRRDGGLL